MNEKIEVTTKTFIVFFGKLFNKFIAVILSFIIVRTLGTKNYGQFTYIMSFITIAVIISKFGIENSLIPFIIKNDAIQAVDKRNSIIKFSRLFVISFSIVVVILLISLSDKILIEEHRQKYILLLPSIILSVIIAIDISILKAYKMIINIVLAQDIMQNLFKLFSIILFFYVVNINSIDNLIFSHYISLFFVLIYLTTRVNKMDLKGKLTYQNIPIYKELILFSLPALFTGVLDMLLHNFDILMIGYFLDELSVGVYRVAFQLGSFTTFAMTSSNTVMAPMIAKLYYENEINKLKDLYVFITKWILVFALIIFCFIVLFNKEIMGFYGQEFVKYRNILLIVSLGQVFNVSVGSVGYLNIMSGNPQSNLIANIIALIINIILNVILVKYFGLYGIAIATVIAIVVTNFIKLYFVYDKLNIHPFNKNYLSLIVIVLVLLYMSFKIKNIIEYNYILLNIFIVYGIFIIGFVFLVYVFCSSYYEKQKINKYLIKIRRRISNE